MIFRRRRRGRLQVREIAPEDVFLDSSNLPGYDSGQFEGHVERPVSRGAFVSIGLIFFLIVTVFAGKAFYLQVVNGAAYAERARDNSLDHSLIFATRGVLYDRTGRELAWNEIASSTLASSTSTASSTNAAFALRRYLDMPGLSHLVGFVRYPKSDAKGLWWRTDYTGMSGVELSFNQQLQGVNGQSIIETDAHRHVQRENIVSPPQNGTDMTLTIDADIQSKLYSVLSAHAAKQGFVGGAAVIMDVKTGELIALTSFPEYDHIAFTDGNSKAVASASKDSRTPLINRAVAGLYAPGSIVKPLFAAAALNEHIISPESKINSTGKLVLPNPYDPEKPSIFRDWTVHGLVDMRTAIAVSSDEYFYVIGGGFGKQAGLGITKIDEYSKKFGLGSETGIALKGEQDGVIPTPAWKETVFGADDPWRIGDTYHTAIGQYGFQVTPLQAVRFTAALANGGKLLKPQLIASSTPEYTQVDIPDKYLKIVREGMRMAVTSQRSDATVKSLNMHGITIAGKTGTAQIGAHNEWMNSWAIGFWPADNPQYAFAVVLEKAKAGTNSGAAPGLAPFFQWLVEKHPEYANSQMTL